MRRKQMTWRERAIVGYICVATGVFSGVLGHETMRWAWGMRQPLFCPFWEKGYCTECKRTIRGGVEVE